ncbi:unnamed protein product, partial [Closterium sp. NIES-54]
DHILALDPSYLTVDLLEQHLLAAEAIVVAVGAARGTPRTPFFEGCSPSPLAPSYASAAAVDVLGAEDVGAASASGKRCNSKGKGGRGGGGDSRGGGGGGKGVVEAEEVVGVVAGVGALVAAVVAAVGVAVVTAVGVVAVGLELLGGEVMVVARGSSSSVRARPRCPSSFVSDFLSVGRLGAAALGASESALPGTALAEALHTFTLDSGASRCFFRDSTTLTPLSAPLTVRLADPSGGPVLALSSTILLCLAVPSGSLSGLHLPSFSTNLVSTAALQDVMVTSTTPGGQHVSICTCTRTGCHLATFTRRPGSSLYTLATEPPQIAASAEVSASGQVAPPCSCRLQTHQTLLWHHRLGHPSLPCLRGMHSCLLVSGLPRSLPPLPPSPALPCHPYIEGRQRAAPHSS